ncbi:MAG: menaquinone biosynthesis protein [Acidobacteriota bacterium]
MKTKIRISLVNYLNSAPLGWAFLHGFLSEIFEVIPSSPARCAEQLSNGDVDIGLIPSIEYQRIPDLKIIPGIAIASLAEVRSILLVSRWEKESIRSVALDTTSRSSVVLTKILLEERLGIQPEYIPHPPDLEKMLGKCDAALLIGDSALVVDLEKYRTIDLAGMWVQWQQKPFVFAFWACRPETSSTDGLTDQFHQAKEWGLEHRSEIAAVYSDQLKLPKDFLERYLVHNINFDLGQEHIRGLEEYYRLAQKGKYIPEIKPLRFL